MMRFEARRLPCRPDTPHIYWLKHEDEFLRGWWVFDPINIMPLGPYDWPGVQRVARSIAAQLAEGR